MPNRFGSYRCNIKVILTPGSAFSNQFLQNYLKNHLNHTMNYTVCVANLFNNLIKNKRNYNILYEKNYNTDRRTQELIAADFILNQHLINKQIIFFPIFTHSV